MASLSETINHLLKTVKNHIGRGGDAAHLPVDNDISGFMTPEMLKQLNSTSGKLPTQKNVDNVFELEAGLHLITGTSTNNTPQNSGLHIVNVIDFSDRKVIYCMHAHTGVMYVYSFNRQDGSDLTPMSKRGWRTVRQEVTLWQGNSRNGNPIILNDSLDRYSRLIIMFNVEVSGITSSIEVLTSTLRKGTVPLSAVNVINSAEDTGVVFSECDITAKDSDTEVEILRLKSVRWHHNGSRQIVSSDRIGIIQIIGIK